MLFVSPEIFMTENEAIQFIPFFIKRLIEEGKIKDDIVLPDKSINQKLAICGISSLTLTQMERTDE